MNIIVKSFVEKTVKKEGEYQGQPYMLVTDRTGKSWFVGDAETMQIIRANGDNAEHEIEPEETSRGSRINSARYIKTHEPPKDTFTEKDKDARIRDSLAIMEVGESIRAGL